MAYADHVHDAPSSGAAAAAGSDIFAVPTVDRQVYRGGMARLASAVNIVTSAGENGWVGLTASAVTSVTDDPATLIVCVNRGAQAHATFARSRILCVNTAAAEHEGLAMAFAGSVKDMVARFAAGRWSTLVTGAPVLEGATAAFDCRIANVVGGNTHDVFFCEVLAVRETPEAEALVYHARKFHRLS